MTATRYAARTGGVSMVAAAFTAVALSASAIGAVTSAPTLCPFALMTGTACPGCGMTRAIVALLHGDLSASWDLHPLAAVVLGQAVLGVGWWAAGLRGRVARPSVRQVAAVLAVNAAALLGVWLLRAITGALPIV